MVGKIVIKMSNGQGFKSMEIPFPIISLRLEFCTNIRAGLRCKMYKSRYA